jgi:hypothetical protein
MWVKSMQSYVITYQRSGDAGFPHKKYKVKKKLGQGATAKVFKVVNYRGGCTSQNRHSKSPNHNILGSLTPERAREAD